MVSEAVMGKADSRYNEACRYVRRADKTGCHELMRLMLIGYGRAAVLLAAMESDGLVGPMRTDSQRDVLVPNAVMSGRDKRPESGAT